MVCKLSFAFSRMSWLKYLFYTDIFLNTYLCMKFSMYIVSASQSHSKLLRNFCTNLHLYQMLLVLVSYTVLYFWPNGDGEIRTLDPLLARQVLSQLSYTPIWNIVNFLFLIWQPPAFPYRYQYSIIGRFRLNHRVRDVDGCFPKAHRHQKTASRALALHALEVSSKLPFVINFH